MQSLYREEILEHYREPLNFGKLSSFDLSSRQLNPFCGDEIELFVNLEKPKKSRGVATKTHPVSRIEEISFIGKGCAISIAAASMLTEFAKGKSKKELTKFSGKDMLDLLGIQISETRKKCAVLALSVLRDCLK